MQATIQTYVGQLETIFIFRYLGGVIKTVIPNLILANPSVAITINLYGAGTLVDLLTITIHNYHVINVACGNIQGQPKYKMHVIRSPYQSQCSEQ